MQEETIVLLDVDDTISYNYPEIEINEPLIQYLKNKKLTKIYFFTDMVLCTETLVHRNKIISILASHAIHVLKILTPNDLLWDNNNYDFKPGQINTSLFLKTSFDRNKLGKAYEDASVEYNYYNQVVNATTEKSNHIARDVLIKLTKMNDYKSVKGLMLLFFLYHNLATKEAKKIVIIDDNPDVIHSVKSVKANLNLIPIELIYVCPRVSKGYFYENTLENYPSLNEFPFPKAFCTTSKIKISNFYQLGFFDSIKSIIQANQPIYKNQSPYENNNPAKTNFII